MDTWLQGLDVVCVTDKILPLDIPQVSGSDKDTHGISSEEKTVFMFNKLKQSQEADWYMFIDDDAILNVRRLRYALPFLKQDTVYGLNMKGSCPKDTSLAFPSGGGGYLVPANVIDAFPPMENHHYFHEDVCVGRYLRDNNVPLSKEFTNSEGQTERLLFGGWFPFDKLKPEAPKTQLEADAFYIEEAKKRGMEDQLASYLTHHYIRSDLIMKYLHALFSTTP